MLQPCYFEIQWCSKMKICFDIAKGLEWLHRHKVLHRDLHTGSILISGGKHALLTDFGLSSTFEEAKVSSPKTYGRRGYVATELLRCRPPPPYEHHHDIF